MKLIEFHIGNATTSSPRHSNTVSSRSVRISRVEVNLACSPCGKDSVCCLKHFDFAADFIEDVSASAAKSSATACCYPHGVIVASKRESRDALGRAVLLHELHGTCIRHLSRHTANNAVSHVRFAPERLRNARVGQVPEHSLCMWVWNLLDPDSSLGCESSGALCGGALYKTWPVGGQTFRTHAPHQNSTPTPDRTNSCLIGNEVPLAEATAGRGS